jgi:hypothetical protein
VEEVIELAAGGALLFPCGCLAADSVGLGL